MTQEATKKDPAGDLMEKIHEQVLYAASRPITRDVHFPRNGSIDHLVEEVEANPKAEIVVNGSGDPLYYILTLDRGRKRDTFYICVDLIDRGYGGPEEGGWHYDSGTVMTFESVRVDYYGDEPRISENEAIFLLTVAEEWVEEFGNFESNHRSSVAPRGDDYRVRVEYDIPKDWNDCQPYC